MFSIGEFSRHGRLSVRMLRHYDAIGLLRPAFVDSASGYRFYQAGQLSDLNRIIALKDLGFTLQQVGDILGEQVSAAELRGMLRLRRAEIHAQIEAETARLARIEARLLSIEDEGRAPADGIVVKRLPPVRVAELTGTAASYQPQDITPVIQPLYAHLWPRLADAGLTCSGPAIAYYEDSKLRAGAVVVHAAVEVAGSRWTIAGSPWRNCRRLPPRRPSSITARWTTSCRAARRSRGGWTRTDISRSAMPASSWSSGRRIASNGSPNFSSRSGKVAPVSSQHQEDQSCQ